MSDPTSSAGGRSGDGPLDPARDALPDGEPASLRDPRQPQLDEAAGRRRAKLFIKIAFAEGLLVAAGLLYFFVLR